MTLPATLQQDMLAQRRLLVHVSHALVLQDTNYLRLPQTLVIFPIVFRALVSIAALATRTPKPAP